MNEVKPEIPAAMLKAATNAVWVQLMRIFDDLANEHCKDIAHAALEAAGVPELLAERDRLRREREAALDKANALKHS